DLEHRDLRRPFDQLAVGRVAQRLRQHRHDVVDALVAEPRGDEVRAEPRDLADRDLVELLLPEPRSEMAAIDHLLLVLLAGLVLATDHPLTPERTVKPLL